jgi:hypothetical protein
MRLLHTSRVPIIIVLFLAFSLAPCLSPLAFCEDSVTQANKLSVLAFEKAAEARAGCDCGLLKEALEDIDQATALLLQAVAEAGDTGNDVLAQRVYYVATNIVEPSIYLISEVSRYCAQATFELEEIGCFGQTGEGAVVAELLNNETIRLAIGAGAIPDAPVPEARQEDPVPDEEYIRDHEQPPASPI